MEVHNKIIYILKTCSNINGFNTQKKKKKVVAKKGNIKTCKAKKKKEKKNKYIGRVYLEPLCFYISKAFLKKIKFFFKIFLCFEFIFLVFLNCFDVLISK